MGLARALLVRVGLLAREPQDQRLWPALAEAPQARPRVAWGAPLLEPAEARLEWVARSGACNPGPATNA